MSHSIKSIGAKMGIGCKPKKEPKPKLEVTVAREEVRKSIDAVYKAEVAFHDATSAKARKKAEKDLGTAQKRKDKAYAALHKANHGIDY